MKDEKIKYYQEKTRGVFNILEYGRFWDYITNLQEENERLKQLCDKYEEEHNNAFKLWTMKMEEMPDYEERMNYKQRNEKAIEYIKSLCYIESKNEWFVYGDDLSPEHIVNILNGDDE